MAKNNLIAIVGMSCRFPGSANSVQEYWENIKSGLDCVTDVPEDRWSIKEHYHYNEKVKGKSISRKGGFIDSFDEFDASFFEMNAREAEYIDPQQRQMLELTWEAFEDAGYKPLEYRHSSTGVFIGGFTLDYKILQFADTDDIGTHTAVGSMMTMLSNRISYIYDFTGPSMSIDTACSSSLVAIHEACRSLQNNECDLAVSGGIELIYTPEYYIAESKGGFLSKDGRCKTLDKEANGYVRGEGGGLLLLKRLEDAERDNDKIYAVIKESLVNQDGKTVGITVPNPDSQMKLLQDIYKRADVIPQEVQYVEIHGTGTSVGDPLESNVIANFFGTDREDNCIVASVKSNIGHLEASSGVASVIKVICSMNEGVIAPHIGMKEMNSKIRIQDYAIKIPLELEEWPKTDHKIAGVNSFGFGGTNAHIILEEYKNEEKILDGKNKYPSNPRLLQISAKSEASVKKMAERYKNILENEDIDAVIQTIEQKREKFNCNLAVVGNDNVEIITNLEQYLNNENNSKKWIKYGETYEASKLTFVFTGMGPQWFAMGRELFENNQVYHDSFIEIDNAFSKYLSWSLVDEIMKDEDDSNISRTDYSQPLNFAVQVSLCKMWESMGIVPEMIVGHSVGEVAAFYVAGVYELDEAVKISFNRSRCQQLLAGKGGMLAVGLSEEDIREYIEDYKSTVSIAAINSVKSITLSGNMDSLKEIADELEKKMIFNKFLRVNIPYHSLYMNEIKEDLLKSLGNLHPQKAKVKLYTTAEGEISDGTDLDENYWWKNVSFAVHFAKAMIEMMNDGANIFVEVGPHPVLGNSIMEIADSLKLSVHTVPSIRRKEPEIQCMFASYAELISLNVSRDLRNVYSGNFKSVELPKYQWTHKKYWREPKKHYERRLGLVAHSLLGYKKDGPLDLWENEINDFKMPFIKDHSVNNQVLVAGAQYIETAFQVIRAKDNRVDKRGYEIRDIEFLNAAFLGEDNVAHLETHYMPDDGNIEVFMNYKDEHAMSKLCFRAKARRRQIVRPICDENIQEKIACMTNEIDKENCYEILGQMGFSYGPMFRGIKKVWKHKDEVIVNIHSLDELNVKDMDTVIHPVILDAAFQSLILTQTDDVNLRAGEGLKLPVSIERVNVYKKVEGNLYAYAKLTEVEETTIKGNIQIVSEDNQCVAEVVGFVAKDLNTNEIASLSENDFYNWLYHVNWQEQRKDADEQMLAGKVECNRWIIFDNSNHFGTKIAEFLNEYGYQCHVVANSEEQLVTVNSKEELLKVGRSLDSSCIYGVLYLAGMDVEFNEEKTTVDDIEEAKPRILYPVMNIINAFNECNIKYRVWCVTKNAVMINENDNINIHQAAMWGMGRVIGQNEAISNWGANIDIDVESNEVAKMLCGDLLDYSREGEIAYRNEVRYVSRLNHMESLQSVIPVNIDDNKYYIISGGMGALGIITARWLINQGAKYIILLGRKILDEQKDKSKLEFLSWAKSKCMDAEYIAMDIQDSDAVNQLVWSLKENKKARIAGIFHSAGVLRDELIMSMTKDEFDMVYDPKAKGAWNLSQSTWNEDLDFFVVYSSAGAVVTSVGQINYASANAFMDALVHYRCRHGRPAQSCAWGPWAVGMVKKMNLTKHYKEVRGMEPIYEKTGMQAFERVLGQDEKHVVICGTDWTVALTNYPGKPTLFYHLAESSKENADEEEVEIIDVLALEDNEEERFNILAEYFIKIISEITHVQMSDIKKEKSLNEIGIDSILATEIRNKIYEKCGVTLAITDILSGSTIVKIVEKIYQLQLPLLDERRSEIQEILSQLENGINQ